MSVTIPFYFRDKEYTLTWNNFEELKLYAYAQHGRFLTNIPVEELDNKVFIDTYSHLVSGKINFYDLIFSQLPENAKIINVGSGVSTLDVLISKILNFKMYLVDRTEFTWRKIPGQPYHHLTRDGHGYYNSWNVLHDVMATSGLDPSSITTLDPDDDWPSDVDLVMSSYSWGWHYPKDIYWDKAMSSLKDNGYLMLDIINKEQSDLESINSSLGNFIHERKYWAVLTSPRVKDYLIKDKSHGGNYIWRKK